MFHYFFLGNPEGIGFDAPDTDYLTCIWAPFAAYLDKHGAVVRTATPAREIAPAVPVAGHADTRRFPEGAAPDHRARHRWRVGTDDGALTTRHLVLATEPGALRDLFAASPDAALAAPRLAAKAAQAAVAPPFAVTRLWLDRDVAPERPTFSAVSREPTLDSVTVYSRLERPSAQWATRTGGSVVELHSYACTAPDVDTATARMRAELAALWPETADARVVHLQQRMEATAPAFPPGGAGSRPTPSGEARGIRVAGDHVETPFLTGLMERAAASGVLAANDVLAEVGAGPEPIRGVPQRGLLAGLLRARRRT
jgi:isorenieratene synthase